MCNDISKEIEAKHKLTTSAMRKQKHQRKS